MAVHQVIVGASPGDAITEIALNTRSLLRRCGLDSEVYGWWIEPAMSHEVLHASRMPAPRADDLLILHTSYGCPGLTALLLARGSRMLLVHHNITPAHLFFEVDPTFSLGLASARLEIAMLRPYVVGAIADSSFNAHDLRSIGYDDVEVCPPLIDPLRLGRVAPDDLVTKQLADAPTPAYAWLGQVLAHKRPDLALNAHHVLVSHFYPDAQLYMLGTHRHPAYVEHLRRHIAMLNLPGAALVGRVTDRQLLAFMNRSSALVITSDHEGFCLPAVEAMALGVPVICRDTGALNETVGDGALLLPAHAGPTLIAAAMQLVHDDPDVRRELVCAGRRRAQAFDREVTEARFLQHLLLVI